MIEVLIVVTLFWQSMINDKLRTFRGYYSLHSFAIQVPLVAISHRMARLVIIGADDDYLYHPFLNQ
jgi:hypothetical protein